MDLDALYEKADNINMTFNWKKPECLKVGNNTNLMDDYNYLTPGYDGAISDVSSLKDHGVIILNTCDLRDHIFKIVAKANQRSSWLARIFIRNTIPIRR